MKLLVGRPKDLALIRDLHTAGPLNSEVVRDRIGLLEIPVERLPRIGAAFGTIFL